ncbi:MAG: glycosyltransferase family 2 protein [Candidatus Beckwithbacteria bacterium]|nr:glycosyltransferase family 2 protein [Candidatus Beckwithbacteria bacterium]
MRGWLVNHEKKVLRALEMMPGLISWSLIIFPIWGAFLVPTLVAYYIIAFDVYWLYRSIWTAMMSLLAHFRLKAAQEFDWLKETKSFLDWRKVHHIVVIPTYKEPGHILERTLTALAKQTYPRENLTVVMAFEEREGEEARQKAKHLQRTYGKEFGNFLITFHPDIRGEVKGKSSNTAWGAKIAKKMLVDKQKADIDYVTITSNDADVILHRQYFAYLTFKFLDDPRRYQKIWQSAIQFYNNIWRLPAITRAYNRVSSVVQTGVLMRRDRLMNFSTYSISLKLVDKVGYWDVDVIPEDYRMFFKIFYAIRGKVEVDPIFLPSFCDAAESTSWWKTMVNQYEQVKRWSWGVSDDAYIIYKWLTVPKMPFWEKTIRSLYVIKDHILWPVNWFAITLGANIPPLLNKEFGRTIIGKTLPQVSSGILTLSLVAFAAIFFVDWQEKPKAPKELALWKKIFSPLEFVLLPVVGFFFTALPGLDAHTRLLLGRYLEYRVTEKV